MFLQLRLLWKSLGRWLKALLPFWGERVAPLAPAPLVATPVNTKSGPTHGRNPEIISNTVQSQHKKTGRRNSRQKALKRRYLESTQIPSKSPRSSKKIDKKKKGKP